MFPFLILAILVAMVKSHPFEPDCSSKWGPGRGSLPLLVPGASHHFSISSLSFCSVTVVVNSCPSLLFVSSLPLRLWVAFVLAYVFLSLLAASPQPALDEEPHIREGNKVFGCSQRETVGLLRLGKESGEPESHGRG